MTWKTTAWRAPMARNQRAESNAMSEWCFQCGVESKPERAVGWDEDGEPACALHRVKAQRPFSLPAPIELPPVIAEPIVMKVKPAAAPSPVQTSAKEKVMAYGEKKCLGCGQGFIPSGARSERCEECRKARIAARAADYRAKAANSAPKTLKRPSKIRKNGDGSFTMAVKTPLPVPESVALSGSGSAESVFGSNRFTAGQLDKLWALLSPSSKAEAIDRLLSYSNL